MGEAEYKLQTSHAFSLCFFSMVLFDLAYPNEVDAEDGECAQLDKDMVVFIRQHIPNNGWANEKYGS
jgi:hypothetical protein